MYDRTPFKNLGKRFCKTNKTKIPLQVHGAPAKVNDKYTWGGFDEISNSLRVNEMLGVFLGPGDDMPNSQALACIDLDKCRNKDGGWNDLALSVLKKTNSYTELSMSGNGLHIFGFCDPNIQSHKKNGIEIYTNSRFIAITGNQEFGEFELNDISDLINQLIDAEFETPKKEKTPAPPMKKRSDYERAEFLVDNLWDKINNYDDWTRFAAAIANTLGKKGEDLFAKFANNPQYSDTEANVRQKYRSFIKAAGQGRVVNFGTAVYIAKKYGVTLPVDLQAWRGAKVTDRANAEIISEELKGEWLFVHDMKSWYYYDHQTGLWQQDKIKRVYTAILEITQRIIKQNNEDRTETSAFLIKNAIALENIDNIRKTLEIASAILPAMICEFDTQTKLVAVKNGIIDLEKMQILPHNPDYRLTFAINANFNPNAAAQKWEKFLNEVQPEPEMQDFIQRLMGATILGANDIQKFPVFYGRGGNGKSVFVDTMVSLFGELSVKLPTAALMMNNNNNDKTQNELFRARAARFVYATETAQNNTLNESVIKDITGGEKITARALYKETIEYYPRFVSFLIGNYRPNIKTADYGIWRRVLLIPWNVEIAPEKRIDKTKLIISFMAEADGILNWILKGVKNFLTTGLNIPNDVKSATEEYKSDSDLIGEFISSEIRFYSRGEGVPLPVNAAFKSFKIFLDANGDVDSFRGTQRKFSTELKNRGYKISKGSGNSSVWIGAELRRNENDF
jgi:putative DNA primase/helicase